MNDDACLVIEAPVVVDEFDRQKATDKGQRASVHFPFPIPHSPLALSALALLIALAWPMLLGRVYTADDLGEFHLPLRSFYSQQLANHEPFDWCPDLYCGFYLTGEGQVGAYHPLHLLLYKVLPLWLAFDLECWLSYPLLLLGTFLLLRRWKIDRNASLFGAMVFTFGGFNLLHFVHPNAAAVIAHLPWLLLAIDFLIRPTTKATHRIFAFAAISFLTGSQLLLGYPQYVLFSILVEAGFAVWLAWSTAASTRATIRAFIRWIAAVAIGFLVGAIQLLPTIDALQHSVRQTASAEFAAQGSLHPLNLLQLIAPYLFETRVVGQNTHELGLYAGAVTLALAFYGLSQSRKSRFRKLSGVISVTAIIALLWAFGTYGPFGWLQSNLPLLNKFRFPCRAIVVFQCAVAVLAALGFMRLQNANLRRGEEELNSMRRALWLLPAVSVIIAVAALIIWPNYVSNWLLVAIGPLLLTTAVWLIVRAENGSRWALGALAVLAAIDLGTYGLSYSVVGHTEKSTDFIESTNAPPGPPSTRVGLDMSQGVTATMNQSSIRAGDRILLAGWKRADGYAGLEPARRLDYRQSEALRIAGVGWIRQADSVTTANWIPLANSQPRAWLVTHAVASSDVNADIRQLPIDNTALVEEPLTLPSSDTPGIATMTADRPGHLEIATNCATQQLLVINESYHTGWQANIDGEKTAVLPADGDFMGVVVPPGEHKISLEFDPLSLKLGRLASAFGLGLIVATLLWPIRPWPLRRSNLGMPA